MHGALCAAIALAGLAEGNRWQGAPIRVAFPVDMRKPLSAGETHAYLISSSKMNFKQEPAPRFWDWARSAKEPIAQSRGVEHARQVWSLSEQILKKGSDAYALAPAAAQLFACEANLSNLGEVSYDTRFGRLKLEALWGPALLMGFADTQTIGAVTTNGQLCLLLANYEPWPKLLPGIERVLREACAN